MFDLELEVRRWCRNATPRFRFRSHQSAELEDHVYCAVAERIKDGTSPESAFRQVTKEIGEVRSLRLEYRKNAGLLSNLLYWVGCRPATRLQYVAGTLCLAAVITFSISIQSEVFAEWARNALVALYSIPIKCFGSAS